MNELLFVLIFPRKAFHVALFGRLFSWVGLFKNGLVYNTHRVIDED